MHPFRHTFLIFSTAHTSHYEIVSVFYDLSIIYNIVIINKFIFIFTISLSRINYPIILSTDTEAGCNDPDNDSMT